MKRQPRLPIWLAFLVIVTACSDAPKPAATTPKEQEKPPEPVTGRFAFHQMFVAARGWAHDVLALRLRSIHLEGVKSEPGKAAAWEATFVSQSRGQAKTYTYSVVEAPGNLHEGVFAGLDESYSGPRGQAKPFLIAALKTDSDEVYKTALKKGARYARKHPDLRISFVLELTPHAPNPAWRVVWGDSVATSNYSILVDASTGRYVRTLR